MIIKEIKTSPVFEKQYKKLPIKVKELAREKEKIFRVNPFDKQLRTHKLHGKEKELLAFWINFHYRIKFIFLDSETVLFLEIGTHGIYK